MSDAPVPESPAIRTLFERIIAGEIPGDFVYRDERCVAFRDIAPVAPVHLLVVPVQPIPDLDAATEAHAALLGHLLLVAARLAREQGIATGGYRVITNVGADGGQTVPHLHLHLIGGRPLGALVGDSASQAE